MARIAEAKELMRANDIVALLIEPGSSLIYFTGVEWWRSERLTAAVLTREGEIAVVTPFFEEPSVRESLGVEAEVLTWNEDENPLATVAAWLGKRSEEHTSELQSLMRISYAVFCLKKKNTDTAHH